MNFYVRFSFDFQVLAGASAGTLQSSVTTPMELLKIKGQSSAKGEFNAVAAILGRGSDLVAQSLTSTLTRARDCPPRCAHA